jgi:hypothetical protein
MARSTGDCDEEIRRTKDRGRTEDGPEMRSKNLIRFNTNTVLLNEQKRNTVIFAARIPPHMEFLN